LPYEQPLMRLWRTLRRMKKSCFLCRRSSGSVSESLSAFDDGVFDPDSDPDPEGRLVPVLFSKQKMGTRHFRKAPFVACQRRHAQIQ